MSGRRACIIGAGASGLTAAQALATKGIDFDWFELGSTVGGNWRYDNDNGRSSAYRSLHINTSRSAMQYAAFPMSDSLPDYASHWQVADYFDSFVDHFGLRERITFDTEVIAVEPVAGRWRVTTRHRAEGSVPVVSAYDDVLVCNGHHWDARWPEPAFPGADDFPGLQLHAHDYRTPDVFEGRTVVVLGIGNSATDISVEASRVARATYLSMRRGAHIVPKYLFGMPTDRFTSSPLARGPHSFRKRGMKAVLRLAVGKMTDYGLPEPDHDVLDAHPTVSDDLLGRLGHGAITVKPGIDRFETAEVVFADGSRVAADVVVYCTGYRVSFPFLDTEVFAATDNRVELYRRVVAPERAGLYFIGLIQPLGAVMPLAEEQALWVAELIAGEVALPDRATMRAEIAAYDEALRRRYVASKRHTLQVDFHDYLQEIRRERRTHRVR